MRHNCKNCPNMKGMRSASTDWQASAREQFELMLLNVGLAWRAEQEKLTVTIQSAAREQFAIGLNRGLRRLRAAASMGEAVNLTVELAADYAEKIALFLFREDTARAEAMRNLGQESI